MLMRQTEELNCNIHNVDIVYFELVFLDYILLRSIPMRHFLQDIKQRSDVIKNRACSVIGEEYVGQ